MKMEVMHMSVAASLAVVFLVCIWRALNWAWFMPKKIEKRLRQQGFNGNRYRLLVGDLKESSMMLKEAMSKPIPVSQDIVQRLMPHVVKTIQTYGKNSFTWIGRMPRVHIMEPELIKDILANHNNFQKNHHAYNPLTKFLLTGIGSLEGEKWAKHRRIISPSFHLEKLKTMLPAFYVSYDELLGKWERESSTKGSVEVDLFPTFDTLTSDVISRVAFGSSYGEGGRIFILLKELMDLTVDVMRSVYVPGWSLLPTKRNQRMREVDREIRERLSGIINSRVKAMKAGEPSGDDLLGTLLESNFREIERLGNKKNAGMSIEDVISECKLFYFAGQETTGILLTWTCVLLSRHPEWQERAREEIFQVFGNGKLDFDRVQGLKIGSGLVGFTLHGSLSHYYYQFCEALFPFQDWWVVPVKVIFDQTAWAAAWNSIYYTVLGLLRLESPVSVFNELKATFWPLLIAGWKLWPFAHLVTYGVIPVEQRLLWVDCIELVWVTILSTYSNEKSEARISEAPAEVNSNPPAVGPPEE